MKALSTEDREFFQLVARAAYVNPFSEDRDLLDAQISGSSDEGPELLRHLLERVEARLAALEVEGPLESGRFRPADWRALEPAIHFETFHRYSDRLDALIETELAGSTGAAPVSFAPELLARLTGRGIPVVRAHRALGLFWQMRRAYALIVTGLTGVSSCMRRLREALWSAVFTHDLARYERALWDRLEDFSLILRGETGTGKGAAAAALGRSGFIPFDERTSTFAERFTELFVPLNLSQFPESLIESELFGHKKGSFTGAIDAHAGAFARVRAHGAIFLDEIGEVSAPVQIKLLRILQERLYCPVGSHEERRFEGRVIAATHRDLDRLRAEGAFRDDFYYRLSSDVIEVPSLRQRLGEDPRELPLLVGHLVERIVGEPDDALTQILERALVDAYGADYAWPGNVRELEQSVRRYLLKGRLERPSVPADGDAFDALAGALRGATLDARGLTARYCALLYARHGTYEEVARLTGLDRRTVRKYVQAETEPA